MNTKQNHLPTYTRPMKECILLKSPYTLITVRQSAKEQVHAIREDCLSEETTTPVKQHRVFPWQSDTMQVVSFPFSNGYK